jgi:D-glycero-D-manno-heptose 1,7-bisphosphate phosphatase
MKTVLPAVFLDRDGVIVEDRPGYVKDWSEVRLIPGAVEALAHLSRRGHLLAVVTNQSAIGRGLTTHEKVDEIHRRLRTMVHNAGGRLSAFFVCPHLPDAACACRKPRPGLLIEAASHLHVDLFDAYMIGDQASDIETARVAGCRAILVLSGVRSDRPAVGAYPFRVARDLAEAADVILDETRLARAHRANAVSSLPGADPSRAPNGGRWKLPETLPRPSGEILQSARGE